jgi:hypothetical protein
MPLWELDGTLLLSLFQPILIQINTAIFKTRLSKFSLLFSFIGNKTVSPKIHLRLRRNRDFNVVFK